ncbi:MAG: hypothetical protein COU31_01495 [Candidatus Magasanikbacteria bacterium CG10_big_fil_rev_8_21_14_0_10_40_10]|uniref:N-acetyltransferase domain-containing protein n=1 Tax=Candidatus Magasanikbacteria bacterium CG10_big_fil_rev_8_21_14_0_10_40_10 TaxID=1974648 RepID=A0A2M6W4N5_9BACT|nr:MAG: hypothetical protein COU31_01495 [Candidatus Magasanikbacteria bacterium CG10_big_fil_rev_8_21_14_0_10_40_10]
MILEKKDSAGAESTPKQEIKSLLPADFSLDDLKKEKGGHFNEERLIEKINFDFLGEKWVATIIIEVLEDSKFILEVYMEVLNSTEPEVIFLVEFNKGQGEIGHRWVHEKKRGKGLGAVAVKTLEDLAKRIQQTNFLNFEVEKIGVKATRLASVVQLFISHNWLKQNGLAGFIKGMDLEYIPCNSAEEVEQVLRAGYQESKEVFKKRKELPAIKLEKNL